MSEEQQKPKSGAPVSRETSEKRETETPPKNKPSSAYIYLLILFGAAFLMLLLAYFVQQRNNQNAIDGLQDSWNLSREQLAEENRKLTEENEELEVRLAVMEDQRDRAYRQIDELEKQYNDAAGLGHLLDTELQCWYDFWGLETSFQEENYEDCAEFFRLAYYSNYSHIPETESAQQRARLIYETLLELGYLAEDDPAVFVP